MMQNGRVATTNSVQKRSRMLFLFHLQRRFFRTSIQEGNALGGDKDRIKYRLLSQPHLAAKNIFNDCGGRVHAVFRGTGTGVGTHDPTLSCQNKRKGEKMTVKE